MIIPAGDDVQLECSAYGLPSLHVSWMVGGLVHSSDVLTLTDVTSSANYTCDAGVGLKTIEHNVQVTVIGKTITENSRYYFLYVLF